MKNDIVECIHWDPEVDAVYQESNKKNRWILIGGAIVIVIVAVAVSIALFSSPKEDDPAATGETTTEMGQATDAPEAPTDPAQTQPPAPPAEDPILTQGIAQYNSGSFPEALATLNQAIAMQPQSGLAYTYRGLTNYSSGSYQAAVQDFTQAMIITGESAELVALRGQAHYMLALYPEAIGDLSRAIALDPGNVNAYTYRALSYDATGQTALAAADRARIGA